MKYKTLCRLLVKLMGVYFIGLGVAGVWRAAIELVGYSIMQAGSAYIITLALAPVGQLGVGLYLFLGGQWIIDRLIPSNRPYCHECGYDLTGSMGNVCAECGTTFKVVAKTVEPHH